MLHAAWAALLLALLTACPGPARRGAAVQTGLPPEPAGGVQRPVPDQPGELHYDGTALQWIGPDGAAHAVAGRAAPVPYRQFSAGPPRLLTALLPGLEPATYALGPPVQTYRGCLPQDVRPPLVALEGLPDPLTGVHASLVLLNPEGTPLWQTPQGWHAELAASPLDASAAPDVAWAFCWQGGDALTPYGKSPELRRLPLTAGAPGGAALPLALPGAAGDLLLLGTVGTRCLVLAQLGYNDYSFVLCDFGSQPQVVARWPLAGQPLTPLTYPGPAAAYAGLSRDGNVLSLTVHDEQSAEPFDDWRFDLPAARLVQQPHHGAAPPAQDAANAADAGQAGPPYPQTILPDAGDAPWTIPAVADDRGRVLVVHADATAEWVAPGKPVAVADAKTSEPCVNETCVTGPGN
jgi:hypothetical protein